MINFLLGMHYEMIMQKLTQIGLLLVSGIFYLVSKVDGSIINKAFDQLFSIGLLVIIVIMLYREWKSARTYNEERDERLEKLIENNTEALNNFRDEFRLVHDRIDENRSLINHYKREQNN